jgi:hypothetical protein
VARKSRYNIPKLFWKCPHCGFEHTPADLLRVNNNEFQCKGCGKEIPVGTWRRARLQCSLIP